MPTPEIKQQEFSLDRDAWWHGLATPKSIGLFDREATVRAVKFAGSCFELPPFGDARSLALLRGPVAEEIKAEIARASASAHFERADWIRRSKPIDLSRLDAKFLLFRGAGHAERWTEGQDRAFAGFGKHCAVAALADGASSSPFSVIGAQALATKAVDVAGAILERPGKTLSPCSAEFLWLLTNELYTELAAVCRASGFDSHFASGELFSSTLHVAIVTPKSVTHLALSDGFFRDVHTAMWMPVGACAPRPSPFDGDKKNRFPPPFLAATLAYSGVYEVLRDNYEHVHDAPKAKESERMQMYLAFREACTFKILSHRSAASVFDSGAFVEIATDGLWYALAKKGMQRFPLDRVSKCLPPEKIETAMALWNIAAEPGDSAKDAPTFCAAGYVDELMRGADRELAAELVKRFRRTAVKDWTPNDLTAASLEKILDRARVDPVFNRRFSVQAWPVGRALVDSYFETHGVPPIPSNSRGLRQLYDDVGLIRLNMLTQQG